MKKIIAILLTSSVLLTACGEKEPEGPQPAFDIETLEFADDNEELSYCLGLVIGRDFVNRGIEDVNVDEWAEGLKDALNKNPWKYEITALQRVSEDFAKLTDEEKLHIDDTMSYIMGTGMAQGMAQSQMTEPNYELLNFGFFSQMEGFETLYDSAQTVEIMDEIFKEKQEALQAEQKVKMEGVLQAEKAFFAENAKREGIFTTPSGIQYEIVKKGSGKKALLTDRVKTHYKGMFLDESVFQSSYEMGKPVEFDVQGVIKGWTELLQLMNKGMVIKAYIPQHLAYGANPDPRSGIPPYSALIFQMELIEIL